MNNVESNPPPCENRPNLTRTVAAPIDVGKPAISLRPFSRQLVRLMKQMLANDLENGFDGRDAHETPYETMLFSAV